MNDAFKASLQAIINQLSPEGYAQGQQDVERVQSLGVNCYNDLLVVAQKPEIDAESRAACCWFLSRLGSRDAVPMLIRLLGEHDPTIRRVAAQSLGEMNAKESVQALINVLLEEKNTEVCEAVAYALGVLGDRRAFDSLVTLLVDRSRDARVRGMAAEALSDLRDSRAIAPLLSSLKDESVEVRFWAVFALGELGSIQTLPELQKLADTDEAVLMGWRSIREEATMAIERIQEQATS